MIDAGLTFCGTVVALRLPVLRVARASGSLRAVAPWCRRLLTFGLDPGITAPQDCAAKQHCAGDAVRRRLVTRRDPVADLRPIVLGDDLVACRR